MVLNALFYTVGGGDLRGTLGQKSSYFCTDLSLNVYMYAE